MSFYEYDKRLRDREVSPDLTNQHPLHTGAGLGTDRIVVGVRGDGAADRMVPVNAQAEGHPQQQSVG